MFPSRPKRTAATREDFLRQASEVRESRLGDTNRTVAAKRIQKWIGNCMARRMVLKQLRYEVDQCLNDTQKSPNPATELFSACQKLLFVFHSEKDNERFDSFCRAVLASMESPEVKTWYVSLSLNKRLAVAWIKQMKQVLQLACQKLQHLKPGSPRDDQLVNLYLNMLVVFTDYSLWQFTAKAGDAMKPTLQKLCSSFFGHLVERGYFPVMHELLLNGLCRSQPGFTKYSLPAAMGIRSLALSHFPANYMTAFVCHVLSVPACILHLQQRSPEALNQLEKVKFLSRIVDVMYSNKEATVDIGCLDRNSVLCIYANLVHLGSLHTKLLRTRRKYKSLQWLIKLLEDQEKFDQYLEVLEKIIQMCDPGKATSSSSTTTWHPLLGWSKSKCDKRVLDSLVHVRKQLEFLWRGSLVTCMFSPILESSHEATPRVPEKERLESLTEAPMRAEDHFLVKEKARKGKLAQWLGKSPSLRIEKSVLQQACRACRMYDSCTKALPQLTADLLVGLGCCKSLASRMWYFVRDIFKRNEDSITHKSKDQPPLECVLVLFCQVAQYLLAILDDEELFVQQKHFTVVDLVEVSTFLNRLVFRMIWEYPSSPTVALSLPPCHSLLMLLYNRDSRRNFCEREHWLIREVRMSNFMSELKVKMPRALELLTKLPHALPQRKRVEIFQQQVEEDRHKLGLSRSQFERHPASYITVHRPRILEDGYTQLSVLPVEALKGTVRVKFINEQGLAEAGIDETGVFKEFLEETIKKAFDPSLNLFKANSAGLIYPSPTSHIQENHLSLFEFVGKMLGKAVYEGIVVDVPFAPFFLSQMLEHHHSALYSSLDELPSMDPELYKSLSYIKHYEGDVTDLFLTFSWDENFLGKVITNELVPGGCGIPVTNENRISYVHKMAHFRMHTQLRKQSAAFIRGFHSLISKPWILCFCPQELQHLISGNQAEIDVDDLRKHTQYFGGYHDKHKVIMWLWDIVKNDFNSQEKGTFLKFVTSCSKAPLLGFGHLEPAFSIRCVDVPEEEDRGDSLGSILRGFFTVRHRGAVNRLPTASTCFNLLKLPNYSKKAILKEKLRYAILANAGFELS